MHLGVPHPRLEARGRPFARLPRSRSRVDLRVLRPLTRGPQGQPSALRTPHGRPGVQGIFPTSRGQAPHGWPLVHHSITTGFLIPRGCYLALSASHPIPCPFPFRHIPSTAQSPRPLVSQSQGAVVWPVPHPFPSPVPRSHPSSRVYTPPGRQQPGGAGPQDPHPSGDRFVLLARVAPIQSPCSAHSARSPLHGPVRGVWPLFPCPGSIGLPVWWHENTACPGGCGRAGTPLHVPPLGFGGELCSLFCTLAPLVVLPSLMSSCRPGMADCPSDVCPSPLMAEGPSFCCSPHTWLGRAAVCVICALGHAGWAAHVIHPCLSTRTQPLFFLRLWPSRDATTRTPARAWMDGVLCCRAPPATSCPCRCPRCRVCASTLGLAGWAASGAPLHPTCPTCGRSDSCMVGVRSGVATCTHVWPAIPGQGPGSAWLFGPGTSVDRRSPPDDPVRGVPPA